MNTIEHSIATKVDVFSDEFEVLLKAINRSIDNDAFTQDEVELLRDFKDHLVDKCL